MTENIKLYGFPALMDDSQKCGNISGNTSEDGSHIGYVE
jgi:hypothetical protein